MIENSMWIDITYNLNEDFPVWPGEQKYNIQSIYTNNISSTVTFNVHTSTHIDAPKHIITDGKTINQIPLQQLIGPTQIITIDDPVSIKPEQLPTIKCQKIIFKTPNIITNDFYSNYCYLTPEAAKALVLSNVELVGINYLSIENFYDPEFTTHKILLGNNVIILESVNTTNLVQEFYEIIALPLNINAEASPARVIARAISL